ncbi:MAG TPA: glutathione binding-like protein, partial [Tahibacter sp.]|nr:glutathione binding-like protein [Tahibacter sp.]
YLADKTGRLIPADVRGRAEVVQWLFWQMAGLGPMAGQIGHFNVYAPEKVPYAIDRYTRETRRLYGVLDRRLADRQFVAGDFSLADVACYPWIVPHAAHGQDLDEFQNIKRWFGEIAARPATRRTYEGVGETYGKSAKPLTDEERRILFGQR